MKNKYKVSLTPIASTCSQPSKPLYLSGIPREKGPQQRTLDHWIFYPPFIKLLLNRNGDSEYCNIYRHPRNRFCKIRLKIALQQDLYEKCKIHRLCPNPNKFTGCSLRVLVILEKNSSLGGRICLGHSAWVCHPSMVRSMLVD